MSALDKQLYELNNRFNDQAMELLKLRATLVPNKVFNVDDLCLLAEKYYPADFTEQERLQLKYELELFSIERQKNTKLSNATTIVELCEILVKIEKRESYSLLDRLLRLILTLPVSTATTERGFSAMKMFKNRLRNKMANKFLADSLVVHIEKEIADTFDSKSIIDVFKNLKGRRAEL
ncbi:hypothetical protein CTI12_AA448880 [Artemisia annua]|uniref:HAT C-terminal dimerisation domain-containing protein n=1 Tax=Artemisia annua TaxID=35608 RepID=A0A2U1LVM1_ARTAN|nr:hypothetical protein CTI12_AA448880 [Artemisia annua]